MPPTTDAGVDGRTHHNPDDFAPPIVALTLAGKLLAPRLLGLAGWGYHARDEYIEIDSIVPRLYLTTRLLMDLGRD